MYVSGMILSARCQPTPRHSLNRSGTRIDEPKLETYLQRDRVVDCAEPDAGTGVVARRSSSRARRSLFVEGGGWRVGFAILF